VASYQKDDKVRVQSLFMLFKSRLNNSKGFMGQRSTLPVSLQKMDMDAFMRMIRNLDPESTGYINFRQLLTYLILKQSKVPTQAEADSLRKLADAEGHISREAFVGASLWFEADEGSTDRDYHEPFERRRMIKEELFAANCVAVEGKDEEQVPVEALIRVVLQPAASKCKTFSDWVFSEVDGPKH